MDPTDVEYPVKTEIECSRLKRYFTITRGCVSPNE